MSPLEYLGWRVPNIPNADNLDIIAHQWCKNYPSEAVKGAMKRTLKGKPGQIEFTEEESNKFKCEVSNLISGLPKDNGSDFFEW